MSFGHGSVCFLRDLGNLIAQNIGETLSCQSFFCFCFLNPSCFDSYNIIQDILDLALAEIYKELIS